MTYKNEDGELITGSSPLEVLTNLKNGSRFAADQPLDEYLEDFMERTSEYYGVPLIHSDYEQTLNQLVEIGYFKEVKIL